MTSFETFYDGEATHAMLAHACLCGECSEAHYWMVNRNGKTRCILCDVAGRQLDAEALRERAVESVRESFRLFRSNSSVEGAR